MKFICTKKSKAPLINTHTCEYMIYMNLMTVDIPPSECSKEGGKKLTIVPPNDGNEELCL